MSFPIRNSSVNPARSALRNELIKAQNVMFVTNHFIYDLFRIRKISHIHNSLRDFNKKYYESVDLVIFFFFFKKQPIVLNSEVKLLFDNKHDKQ